MVKYYQILIVKQVTVLQMTEELNAYCFDKKVTLVLTQRKIFIISH